MVQSTNSLPLDLERMVSKITESGRISRADQQVFMSTLLSKANITSAEQAIVDRMFELLRSGRLRVVD